MRFIPFPASILSNKNAHKFCTFLLFAFTKLVSHMSSCFFLSFFMVLTCYNPCSYPIWLHFSAPVCHTSKNALETFSLLFPLFECKLAPFGSRARVRGWFFSFYFSFVYSNLRASNQLQSVCLFVLRFHQFREMLCDFKS